MKICRDGLEYSVVTNTCDLHIGFDAENLQDIYRCGNRQSAASLAFRRSHRENKPQLWEVPKHTATNWWQHNIVVNLWDDPQKERDDGLTERFDAAGGGGGISVQMWSLKMSKCRRRGGCGAEISSDGCRPFQEKRLLTSIYQGRSEEQWQHDACKHTCALHCTCRHMMLHTWYTTLKRH